MEENSAFQYQKKRSFGSILARMMFSHVGLFLVIIAYACLGAHCFVKIERGTENYRYKLKQRTAMSINQTLAYTTSKLWSYGDKYLYNFSYPQFRKKVNNDLKKLAMFIIDAVENENYDGTIDGWSWDWTFMNSLFLCMTILTTIGYGNIAPVTSTGQMFCIAYALLGCPLFLVFLANLGESMAKGFIYLYSRCCCRTCRSQRYMSELPEGVSKRSANHVIDDIVDNESYMPTSKVFVPIVVNIVVLHLYFFLGGILFATWENWPITSSIYFTFITLSTIGYGDLVPGNSLTDNPDSIITTLKLLISVLYIIIGMSLLSMCINLMQEQLVQKCHWAGQKLGIVETNCVSEPDPVDKRKDSLLPLMESNTGPSPFRHSGSLNPQEDSGSSKIEPRMPGILE